MNEADLSKLYKAARAGDVKVTSSLLPKLNPKLSVEKEWLDRSLMQAVINKSVAVVELLLKAGANPDQKTSIGTLVAWPAANGDLPMVKALVTGGADFNRELNGETALSAALEHSQGHIVDYLEKHGAYSPPDATLLHASANGDTTRARKALAAGADPGKTGGVFENTPLMEAARKGRAEIVKLLLKHGVDVNQSARGGNALFDAVRYGKDPVVFELLIAAGADIRAKHYDETVLMAAAGAGCLPIVKRLVELGADVGARDKNFNKTALDCAKSGKHQEVVDFLTTLGAKSNRDAGRTVAKALAKEFGGRPVEHSHGFLLNSKLNGNLCQFSVYSDRTMAVVFKLNYRQTALKNAGYPGLIFSGETTPPDPYATSGKKVVVKSATQFLGVTVRRAADKNAVPEKFILEFCRQHADFFKQLKLSAEEQVGITSEATRFYWVGTDFDAILPRLRRFENFIREISSPPLPERRLVEREWLIKPVSKKGGGTPAAVHTFGGRLAKPVACPHCGVATNLMAHIDLSDRLLPPTALGRRKLPVFWCLECGDWDPAFYNLAGAIPKPLSASGKKAAAKIESGEEDLEECRVTLVPVPAGKKAGRKSKVGGSPAWIQAEATPACPKCQKPMAFVLQLASDSRISYCDSGMLYAFACPDCKISASLIQSH